LKGHDKETGDDADEDGEEKEDALLACGRDLLKVDLAGAREPELPLLPGAVTRL